MTIETGYSSIQMNLRRRDNIILKLTIKICYELMRLKNGISAI